MQVLVELVLYFVFEVLGAIAGFLFDKVLCGIGAWTKRCFGYTGGSDWSDALTGIAVIVCVAVGGFVLAGRIG